jgi:1,4-alpha-glucan branching enzyme
VLRFLLSQRALLARGVPLRRLPLRRRDEHDVPDHGNWARIRPYDDYFPPHVDEDAIAYLQLANQVAHEIRPGAITIAEDVSGMVGIARPLERGRLGFDYRLAMGIPDYWIKLLKHSGRRLAHGRALYHTLTNRRQEKHIAYARVHDQALVGDKTIAFWLMDADMYWHMNQGSQNPVIERGVALHKMIRLVTFAFGGEGYLNFMGNEFGHPEWVDFPREGNGFRTSTPGGSGRWWTTRCCAITHLARLTGRCEFRLLAAPGAELLHEHEDNNVLVAARGGLVFAFNFHPTRSLVDYRVAVPQATDYRLQLNTDDLWFGGHGEVLTGQHYPHLAGDWDGRPQSLKLYLPARTALVLAPLA